jgi:hypothetical protein
LAAAGFIRMAAEVLAMGPPPPIGPDAVTAQMTLAAWKNDLTMAYLGAILVAVALGRLRALVQRRLE